MLAGAGYSGPSILDLSHRTVQALERGEPLPGERRALRAPRWRCSLPTDAAVPGRPAFEARPPIRVLVAVALPSAPSELDGGGRGRVGGAAGKGRPGARAQRAEEAPPAGGAPFAIAGKRTTNVAKQGDEVKLEVHTYVGDTAAVR